MMEYKGYRATYKYDEEEGMFIGDVVNVAHDVIYFYGDTVEHLHEEFRFSIDDYLSWCAEDEKEPDKPLSENVSHSTDS